MTAVLAVEEPYEAGPTALFVIALLGIGIFLLARSMLKHLRRVPASFDPPEPDRPTALPEVDPADAPAPPSGEVPPDQRDPRT